MAEELDTQDPQETKHGQTSKSRNVTDQELQYSDKTTSIDKLLSLVNTEHIRDIHKHQLHILNRLETANAKLTQVNKFSIHNFIKIGPQIKKYTRTLLDTKKELDSVFHRIRILQSRIQAQYPDHYKQALSKIDYSDNMDDDNN
ncbi:hypothetical protein LOD99_2954 [Oopsacas minuta]|uniref:KxDL domain-containing protein n=1 Tax=Oopsacas minuta TaxID=111878 RepID=A0AAV7JYJ9_9METZ|nr:hypothetical protein LOD99_2954 [Oopsacas minuta]